MVNWKYIKEFGLYIFFVNGVSRILRKMKCKPSTLNAYDRFKHKIDEAYLLRKYEYLLKSNHIEIVKKSSIGGGKHTFVFWWQGFETAPEIVKLCINSMKKHADDLVLIDKNNYTQWVGLPDYIVSKFNTGDISLAHFSDVIRFYLLYFYGGTWIDATCFLSREIPGEIRETEFWSINGAYKNILGWRWTSFFMCGQAGNTIAKQMLTFYYEYWKQHNCAITYLFLDCWLTVLCKNDSRVSAIINALPDNEYKVFYLISNLNAEYNTSMSEDMVNKFFVYKLTYKEHFDKLKGGNTTLYGYLLSEAKL